MSRRFLCCLPLKFGVWLFTLLFFAWGTALTVIGWFGVARYGLEQSLDEAIDTYHSMHPCCPSNGVQVWALEHTSSTRSTGAEIVVDSSTTATRLASSLKTIVAERSTSFEEPLLRYT
ncbi:hypothetical protein K488DRAFT_72776 [Vararia minispora EC-137]|uniref:Uncharacterized protein n=1 Tax=Vararia minispora EC-137 TaxID=1314806 RepID=A0ACB8QD72_9AGAM|nr:hypothetical protein K488DRAFT_72776 [Vararia minispora EC-137]